MRVAIATVQVPFIRGGAESLADGLAEAMCEQGHEVDVVSIPFRFAPASEIQRSIEVWESEDFREFNGCSLDRVICLKFPAYYLSHLHKRVWLIHQHRAVYDLWETPHDGGLSCTREGRELRERIAATDVDALKSCERILTIAERVSERLRVYSGLGSTPLYHPPPLASRLYTASSEPYVFFPSRLEKLKRQDLLIEAMALVRSPVVALLAGEGGCRAALEQQIEDLGLRDRVRLIGWVSDEELLAYYARSLAVFFGPYDEDYGLVGLEAMLASKPLITCTDSGEPTRFVAHRDTGFVVEPEPEALAVAIEKLALEPGRASAMGRAGRERYESMDVSWDRVLQELLGN